MNYQTQTQLQGNDQFPPTTNHQPLRTIPYIHNMSAILIYFSLFLGIFLSGEFVFVAAVIGGAQAHYSLWLLLPIAFMATWLSDILFFELGHRKGSDWIEKKRNQSPRINRFLDSLDEHENKMLFSYRFIFGFRAVLLMLIGSQEVDRPKFMLLSFLATAAWIMIYGGLGIFFGSAVTWFLDELKAAEFYIIGALIATTIFIGLYKWMKRKKSSKVKIE